jgi:hypothetical protein
MPSKLSGQIGFIVVGIRAPRDYLKNTNKTSRLSLVSYYLLIGGINLGMRHKETCANMASQRITNQWAINWIYAYV